MQTITPPPSAAEHSDTESSATDASDRRVHSDLRFGSAVLAVVIGGNLLWHASDAGILTVLGSH
ncbi:hypothetical protein [Aeromicrobium stalagmiti]|uniref:hypothetical protein n=1 Tax=Aeromicrobium stalagmiti TaxID=2738988 RepID=UPI00156A1EFD|nr:hypothetical protein [Aeromicrobium stalagmiti]NRQ49315.1 hypothetical protein [Aeromicrobium stalagmiti]